MGAKVDVLGVDDLVHVLENVLPRHANNLMRNTVRGVAAEIRKDIRKNTPKRTGRLGKPQAIKVKMRRAIRGAHLADVVFTNRGFYWRYVEHGTAGPDGAPAQPFVAPARRRALSQLDQMILQTFTRTLDKTMKRELKKQRAGR